MTNVTQVLHALISKNVAVDELYFIFLLDACLYHSVLARSVTETSHVAFKYKRRLNFVELLK